MNLVNFLYDPIVIIIIVSILITVITYFIIRNGGNEGNEGNEENKKSIPKVLLYTFIISLIILTLLKYILQYLNKNQVFQRGGFDITEKITVIDNDVDIGLIDE
jgi:uncharacterized membrane protein